MTTTAQNIILDALEAKASELLSDEDYYHAVDNAPQSHVFYPSEDDYGYDEDDYAAMSNVMDGDVAKKIQYWTRVLNNYGSADND